MNHQIIAQEEEDADRYDLEMGLQYDAKLQPHQYLATLITTTLQRTDILDANNRNLKNFIFNHYCDSNLVVSCL